VTHKQASENAYFPHNHNQEIQLPSFVGTTVYAQTRKKKLIDN